MVAWPRRCIISQVTPNPCRCRPIQLARDVVEKCIDGIKRSDSYAYGYETALLHVAFGSSDNS